LNKKNISIICNVEGMIFYNPWKAKG